MLTQDYGDWSQLALNVDIINLHTYDFTSSTTSFSSCIGSEDTKSIKGTVENCKNAEIDLSKLNVGIPFHGIGFRLKDPSKHELNNAIINGSQFELPYSKVGCNAP